MSLSLTGAPLHSSSQHKPYHCFAKQIPPMATEAGAWLEMATTASNNDVTAANDELDKL